MTALIDEPTVKGTAAYNVGALDSTLCLVLPVSARDELFWVRQVEYHPRRAPEAPRLARELQKWTGWPTRVLAEVLRTTHPTVQSLMDGGSPATSARSVDLRYRLRRVHEVVERIFVLCGRDMERTDALLRSAPDDAAPFHLLSIGDYTAAYLRALDIINPAASPGLAVGRRPSTPGAANRALHEE